MPDKIENIIPFIKSSAAFNEPLIIMDERMNVPYVNKPAEKLFNIKRNSGKRLPIGKLIDLKKGDKEKILYEANKTRSKRRILRFNIYGKDEFLVPVEVSAAKIKEGDKVYYLLKVNDLSEKVNTIDKLRNEKKNIELLKSIAIAANQSSSFEVAIRFSLNKICQNTGWHIGHAYRVHFKDRLVLESIDIWAYMGKTSIESLKKRTEVLTSESANTLPMTVLKKKKAQWVSEIVKDNTFIRSKEVAEAGIKAAIAFPIVVEDNIVAVVEFFSKQNIVPPDKKFLELIENIGIILGRVIERESATENLENAYQKLHNAQKNLLHNEKLAAIGKFSAGLAHEIRNPLANINAAVQYMIGKYQMDERLKDSLAIIERNGKSATNIINEMLRYTAPVDFEFEKGSVADVITDIIKMTKARCEEMKVKCVKKIAGSIPDIKINKDKLEEALLNFFSNAIDSMEEGGGTLTISAEKDNNSVVIKVRDTGKGISEKDLDRIFDPFFTKKKNGTGLGMGLALNIIKAHKGEVFVNSKIGEGTEIVVSLPI